MHTAAGQVLHAETLMLVGNHHSLFTEYFIERGKNCSTTQLTRVECAAAQRQARSELPGQHRHTHLLYHSSVM